MNALTSTKGELKVPINWLPPEHPDFMVKDAEVAKCFVAEEEKPVTRLTGVDRTNPKNPVNWVEYWLDIGYMKPELIHRSAHVTVTDSFVSSTAVSKF